MRRKQTVGVSLDELIEKTRTNIDNDRAAAHSLLINVMTEILKDPGETHGKLGFVASKYLEALQRSSEQQLKLISTISAKTVATGDGNDLPPDTKDDIFDELQEEYTLEMTEAMEKAKAKKEEPQE
jgi:hypothetical protein